MLPMSTAPLSEGRWLKNSVHSHGGGGRWLVLVTEQPSTFNIAAQKMIPVQTILCIVVGRGLITFTDTC